MNRPRMPSCDGTAVFSSCGRYRYVLSRRWSEAPNQVVWIMLNPSKADATHDDPTIRRCISFSQRWGYGGMIVANLFALCATCPMDLLPAADPVGSDNDRHIAQLCAGSKRDVVAAWGTHPLAQSRARHVSTLIGDKISCLGTTRDGCPRHPLYISAAQPRMIYRPASRAGITAWAPPPASDAA